MGLSQLESSKMADDPVIVKFGGSNETIPAAVGDPRRGRSPRSLERLAPTSRYVARPADEAELQELAELVERHIPGIENAFEAASRMYSHHSESIFGVFRNGEIVGCAAVLYLSPKGLDQLLARTLSVERPAVDCLTPLGSKVTAIYTVVVCLPKVAAAVGNIMRWLQYPLCRHADLYANAATATAAGARFQREMGFAETDTPGLWVYHREEI